MYLLEDRILFDGAAAADVAAVLAEAEAQQEAQQEEAEQEAEDQQSSSSNTDNDSSSDSSGDSDVSDANSESDIDIDALIADALNSADADADDVTVLIVSDDISNYESLVSAASESTIVITYDPDSTSLSDLLQQVKDSLGDAKADSIAFAVESTDSDEIVISTSDITSLDSLDSDSDQQAFWEGIGSVLDTDGRIDLLCSDLTDSQDGIDLVDHIADLCDADVAASDDITGADGDWILETGDIDVAEVYFDGEKIDAFTDNITINMDIDGSDTNEVAFINSSVMENDTIVAELEAMGIDVVVLDSDSDALDQISDYLAIHDGLDSIRIITHGNDGYFVLGGDVIDSDYVSEHAEEIAEWGDSLTDDGDILIYGCDLTASDSGVDLVHSIADLTGADVAASDDVTGVGGDWDLEYSTGTIEVADLTVGDYVYRLTSQVVSNADDSGTGSLRDAIELAEDGDTIVFTITAGSIITLSSSITIDVELTIEGGTSNITISGDSSSQIFIVDDGLSNNSIDVVIENVTLSAGSGVNGGAINNSETLTLYGVEINSSEATNGGAVYNTGDLTVTDSTLTGNSAENGGAIYNSGTLTVNIDVGSSYITSNAATANGGAIYSSAGTVSISNTLIGGAYADRNEAANGGAIYVAGGTVTISSTTTVSYNEATDGGGIYVADGRVNLYGEVSYNTATSEGGGIYIAEDGSFYSYTSSSIEYNEAVDGAGVYNLGAAYFSSNSVDNNIASNDGGGIYNTGTATISYADVYSNTATEDGGGIYNTGTMTVSGADIYLNIATNGGGGAIYTSGELTVTSSSTIGGNGTANQASYGGAIYVADGSAVVRGASTISYNEATSTNGGGVYVAVDGSFGLIESSTVSYNEAVLGAGLYVLGYAYVNASTIDNNIASGSGGGVYSTGTITVKSGSVISNNTSVGSGGGIWSGGSLTVYGSYIGTNNNGDSLANSATGDGGGIYIASSSDDVTITGSTIANNIAISGSGGGIFNAGVALTIDSYTVNDTTYGSTVDGNSAGASGDDIYHTSEALTISDATIGELYLVSDVLYMTGSTVDAFNNVDGTVITSYASGSYWGMLNTITTQASTNGSVFIDSLNTIGGTTGYTQAEIYSIYQKFAGLSQITVTVAVDVVDLDDEISLREAVIFGVSGSTIVFNSDADEGAVISTVALDYGELTIINDLTIDGTTGDDEDELVVINNTTNSRVFSVDDTYNSDAGLTVTMLSFGGGSTADRGGAVILYGGTATFDSSVIGSVTAPNAASYGGAIYVSENATLNLTDTIVVSSSATYGGAIYNDGGTVSLTGTISDSYSYSGVLSNNSATYGGAIYNNSGSITISGIYFGYATGNSATDGGAIYNNTGTITISGSTVIANNIATGNGAGIYNASGTVSVSDSIIGGNDADVNGGGIYNVSGTVNLDNTIVGSTSKTYIEVDDDDNENEIIVDFGGANTAVDGGGIYNDAGTVTITNGSIIRSNDADDDGGGIYNAADGYLAVTDSTVGVSDSASFTGNTATDGGGIYNLGSAVLTDSVVSGNAAAGNGGGIYNDAGGYMFVTSAGEVNADDTDDLLGNSESEISGNTAAGSGGGIYNAATASITVNLTLIGSDDTTEIEDAITALEDKTYTAMANLNYSNTATSGYGGGIYNAGTVTVTASYISLNDASGSDGGGIYNDAGTVTIVSSLISANHSYDNGGGIYNDAGTVTIGASTTFNSSGETVTIGSYITGNLAGYFYWDSGYSLSYNNGSGGGIYNSSGSVTITLSTVSSNISIIGDGGGIYNTGTLYLYYATISSNTAYGGDGGGIYTADDTGTATITSIGTTISSNTSENISIALLGINWGGTGGGVYDVSTGTVSFTGGEISSNSAGLNGAGIYTTNDLSLSAVDFSGNSAGGDGGAVYITGASLTVSGGDFDGNSGDSGGAIYITDGTLDVSYATFSSNNTNSTSDTYFGGAIYAGGTTTASIIWTEFSSNYAYNGGAIYLVSNVTVSSFANNTFTSNHASNNGGAVYSATNLSVSNSTFTYNYSYYSGGAIYFTATTLTVSSSDFTYNTSYFDMGGAIYFDGTTLTVTSSNFGSSSSSSSGNSADEGGAIYLASGTGTIDDSGFYYNDADDYGGAVTLAGSTTLTINQSTFTGNKCEAYGGAIYSNDSSTLTINDTDFTSNTATYSGGAIMSINTALTINDSNFYSNTATVTAGGAIYYQATSTNGSLAITRSNIGAEDNGNTAGHLGGGIYIVSMDGGDISIADSTISYNSASETDNGYGGGIYLYFTTSSTETVTISDTDISYNTATVDGGGIYVYDVDNTLTITGSTINYNEAETGSGGGIYIYSGDVSISDQSTLSYNTAYLNGGAIYVSSSSTLTTNIVTISYNTAGNVYSSGLGGGIYSEGTLNLTNTTLAYNTAYGNGGGIYTTGNLTIAKSTINNNTAYDGTTAGIYMNGAYFDAETITVAFNDQNGTDYAIYLGSSVTTAEIGNSTIAFNGFGVYSDSANPLVVTNSLLIHNGSTDDDQISGNYSTITDNSFVRYDNEDDDGNQILETSLADAGGWVLTLAVTSDFYNGGNSEGTDGTGNSDARGYLFLTGTFSRTLGAYQYNAYVAYNTTGTGGDGNSSGYYYTVDSAVLAADAGDTIEIISTRVLVKETITIDLDLTLDGTGATVLDAGDSGITSIISITDTATTVGDTTTYSAVTVTVSNMTLTGIDSSEEGSAVISITTDSSLTSSTSSITIETVTIEDNSSYYGGIYNKSATLTVTSGSTFEDNTAAYGGAIYNDYGTLEVYDSYFYDNTATYSGGAIYSGYNVDEGVYTYGSLTISGSTFIGNSANYGGAVCVVSNSALDIDNSTFSYNTATYSGGGIHVEDNDDSPANTVVTITNTVLTNNSATYGGAVCLNGNTITAIVDIDGGSSEIQYNTATYGGGIYSAGATLYVEDTTLSHNTATVSGGALYATYYTDANEVQQVGSVTFSTVDLEYNTASYGGAIYNYQGGSIIINAANILGNSATYGGAIYVSGEYSDSSYNATVAIDGSSVVDSNSASYGGAVYNEGGLVIFSSGAQLTNNSATYYGGAIYNSYYFVSDTNELKGEVTLNGVTITGNYVEESYYISNGEIVYYGGGAIYNLLGTVTITGGTMTANATAGSGGAIYNLSGTVSVTDTDLDYNIAGNYGGAVYNYSSYSTVNNSDYTYYYGTVELSGSSSAISITHNRALSGGAIYNGNNGIITIDYANLSYNVAVSGYGGAVYNYSSNADGTGEYTNIGVTISGDTDVSYNYAVSGGAIYNNSSDEGTGIWIGTGSSDDIEMIGNIASQSGGTIYNASGYIYVGDTGASTLLIQDSSAGISGGGIYNAGTAALENIEFDNADAVSGSGGAIYNSGDLSGYGITISGSNAIYGGAVYAFGSSSSTSTATFSQSVFTSNYATYGSVAYLYYGDVTISGSSSLVYSNTSTYSGGAFQIETSGTLTISGGAQVYSNTSLLGDGGAIYNNGGSVIISSGSTIYDNSTRQNGGAIYNDGGSVTISDSTIYNSDALEGGAIYNTGADAELIISNGSVIHDCNATAGSGGAIYNDAYVLINDSDFYDNSATENGGAIFTDSVLVIENGSSFTNTSTGATAVNGGAIYVGANGGLTMTDSSIVGYTASADGGAIYSLGLVVLESSTISGNTAVNGGGIYIGSSSSGEGGLTTSKSTITLNTATGSGGGIYNLGGNLQLVTTTISTNLAYGSGGGIYSCQYSGSFDEIIIQQSTIDNNTAMSGYGGGLYTEGNSYIYASTIAYNYSAEGTGSAIYVVGDSSGSTTTIELENVTIAYNDALAGVAVSTYSVTLDSDTSSSIYVSLINSIVAYNNAGVNSASVYNIQSVSSSTTSITSNYSSLFVTGELEDNGGWVKTIAISTSGSAYNSGTDNGADEVDARGYYINSTRDIGAYEANAYVAYNTNTLVYYTSIQDAIDAASTSTVQTISIVGSRVIVDSTITIDSNVVLTGSGSGETVLDGLDATQIMSITSSSSAVSVSIDGMSFVNGYSDSTTTGGGAIYNTESLYLNDVIFDGNNADNYGGAIYNAANALVYVEMSSLTNNSAVNGGAIYNYNGTVYVEESTLENNSATDGAGSGSGGAIYSVGSSAVLTITSSTLNNNSAEMNGGAVYAQNEVTMTNTTLAFNTSGDEGSAIYLTGNGTWEFTNVTSAYNESGKTGTDGYAIYVSGGTLTMTNDLFVNSYNASGTTGLDINIDNENISSYDILYSAYNAGDSTVDGDQAVNYFTTSGLLDNGGWVKTLAINDVSFDLGDDTISLSSGGTVSGTSNLDARGYYIYDNGSTGSDTNRSLGAYEYEGTIGTMTYHLLSGNLKTIYITSINSRLATTYSLSEAEITIDLAGTRIIENDISVSLVYNTGSDTAALTVNIYGSTEGDTVLSAGGYGDFFTVRGGYNNAGNAVLGVLNLYNMTLSDAVDSSNPLIKSTGALTSSTAFTGTDITVTNNISLSSGGVLATSSESTDISFEFTDSTFSYNISGGDGGAFAVNAKNVTMSNCTITANRAMGSGGAIYVSDAGGSASLSYCTVAYNYSNSEGAGVYNAKSITSNYTIWAKNRSATYDTSYLSTDQFHKGYDYYNATGEATVTTSYSLCESQNGIGDTEHTYFFGKRSKDTGDITDGSVIYEAISGGVNNDFIGLGFDVFETGRLADNGGYSYTLQLSENSAARDATSVSSGADDQRGYGIVNYRDIGALELNGTYVTNDDTGVSYSSIAAAVAAASSGDTLTLAGTRIVESGITITKNITINGTTTSGDDFTKATITLIDAKSYGRVFSIDSSSATVTMTGLYITESMSLSDSMVSGSGNGGAIYSIGTLVLNDVIITDSFAQISGGAIYSTGSLAISSSNPYSFLPIALAYNTAGLSGGAIYASGEISLTGVEFDAGDYTKFLQFNYNTSGIGGAIYLVNVTAAADSSLDYLFNAVLFNGNSSSDDGGAMYVESSAVDLTFNESYFINNVSGGDGGALYVVNVDVDMLDTAFEYNIASESGGAFYFDGGTTSSVTFHVSENTEYDYGFYDNISINGDGGAMYVANVLELLIYSDTIAAGPTFSANETKNGNGGAIYVNNAQAINIANPTENAESNSVIFKLNVAGAEKGDTDDGNGGALYVVNSADCDINIELNVSFNYNVAYGSGGAIYLDTVGNLTTGQNVSFNENGAYDNIDGVSTGKGGGAIYANNTGDITLDYTAFANNFSGAYYTYDETSGDYIKIESDQASTGGALYLSETGSISFNDVDAYDNMSTGNGGFAYITNTTGQNITITSSSFDNNRADLLDYSTSYYGGAFYITNAADITITDATFCYNTNTALYVLQSNSLTISYSTFAYNESESGFASSIYYGGDGGIADSTLAGRFQTSNSIYYDTDEGSAPVYLTANVSVTTSTNYNNLFYRYDSFVQNQTNMLSSESYSTIYSYVTTYDENGDAVVSINDTGATLKDSYNNLIGTGDVDLETTTTTDEVTLADSTNNYITANLYLATEILYAGNQLSRTLAIESSNSIAYQYATSATASSATRAGNNLTGVTYDQRGNMRSGITISVASDGTVTYSYGGTATSIGAYEANFYMTVTTNTDNTTNPATMIHSSDSNASTNVWYSIDNALEDGVTLREAIYWIDNYTLGSYDATTDTYTTDTNCTGVMVGDADRYVKFADTMFNDVENGSNVITLSSTAETIVIDKDVIIGMISDYYTEYDDSTAVYSFFNFDNTYMAQDSNSRITIDGNNLTSIFAVMSQSDNSADYFKWTYDPSVGLNNITIVNGYEDGYTVDKQGYVTYYFNIEGKGGGIYNDSTLILHNTVIDSCVASNESIDYDLYSESGYYGDGGGIYNNGTLYMYDSTIQNCEAIGLGSTNSVENVGLGGGVFSEGTLYVVRSTFDGNYAQGYSFDADNSANWSGQGAGIYIDSYGYDYVRYGYNYTTSSFASETYIYSSTITNSSLQYIVRDGTTINYNGSAITIVGGTNYLVGNTIAYNVSYNGTYAEDGAAVFLYGGRTYLYNNIIAENYRGDYTEAYRIDIMALDGTVSACSDNIIGSYILVNDYSIDMAAEYTDNIYGNNNTGEVANLFLSTELKYNGGITKSYRIAEGSVAIEAADTSIYSQYSIDYDQRNLTNDVNGNVRQTIGAYELLTIATVTIEASSTDTDMSSDDVGYNFENDQLGWYGYETTVNGQTVWVSGLRETLYMADYSCTVTIINNRGTDTAGNPLALALTYGALEIFSSITVTCDGTKEDALYIDANGSQAFIIDSSQFEVVTGVLVSVTLDNFNITNSVAAEDGVTSGNGGAIYCKGSLTLIDTTITGSTAYNSGGSIYVVGGTLTMNDVNIYESTATNGHGGAVYVSGGSLSATDVFVGADPDATDNDSFGGYAGGSGGAFYLTEMDAAAFSNVTIENSTAAEGNGGAIFFSGTVLTVDSSTIGGSEETANSAITLSANGSGGGIYALLSSIGGSATITDTNISYNTATSKGGGVYVSGGSLTLENSSESGDNAEMYYIRNNSAQYGGGLYVKDCTFTVGNSSLASDDDLTGVGGYNIIYNIASSNGGGIYLTGSGDADIEMTTIGNNTSGGNGGGIYANIDSLVLINSTISGNTAEGNGGGIYFYKNGNLDLTYTTVANNIASYVEDYDADAEDAATPSTTDGGGIYMYRGTLTLDNSVVAQNWSVTTGSTDSDDYHSDLYISTSASASGTYSVVGTVYGTITDAGNLYTMSTSGSTYTWSQLALSDTLEDNGGWTLTLYVYNDSDALMETGSPMTLTSSIVYDQRGTSRLQDDGSGGYVDATIGAYQKPSDYSATYYYYGTGSITDASNWYNAANLNDASFDEPDYIFVFDNTKSGLTEIYITTDWTINSKSTLEINDVNVTLSSGNSEDYNVLTAALTSIGTYGSFTVETYAQYTAVGSGDVDVSGELTIAGVYAGSVTLLSGGILVINAPTANYTNLSLSSPDEDSTVKYTYEGDQKVIDTTYGYLVIGGSGLKTFTADVLEVTHNLTFAGSDEAGEVTLSVTAGDIDVDGDVLVEVSDAGNNPNVTVDVSGDIVVDGAFDFDLSGGSDGELTLTANSLTVGATAGDLTLYNSTITLSGTTEADADSSLVLNGDLILYGATVNATGGNINFYNTGSTLSAVAYNSRQNTVSTAGVITVNSSSTISATDLLIVVGDNSVPSGSTLTVEFTGEDTDILLHTDDSSVSDYVVDWSYNLGGASDYLAADGLYFIVENASTSHVNTIYTNASNSTIYGTLGLQAEQIVIDTLSLSSGSGSLSLYSTVENFKLDEISADGSITLNGDIDLLPDTGDTSTIDAGTFVKILGSIYGDSDRTYNLTITAGTAITLNNIYDVKTLSVDSSTDTITLQGEITADTVNFNDDNTINIDGSDVSITTSELTIVDSAQILGGTGDNLTLNITDAGNDVDLSNGGLIQIDSLTLAGAAEFLVANITLEGNLTDSSAGLTINNNLTMTGSSGSTRNQTISTVNGIDIDGELVVNNTDGSVTLTSGQVYVVSQINWGTDAVNLTLSDGDLKLLGSGGTNGYTYVNDQYIIITGEGSLYRYVDDGTASGGSSTFEYRLGVSDTTYGFITLSSTDGSDLGWVGVNVEDGVKATGYNANIRGLAKTTEMTYNVTSSGALTMTLEDPHTSGSSYDGADTIYQKGSSISWDTVDSNAITTGTYMFANATMEITDFYPQGMIYYPTEGWMLGNNDNDPNEQSEPVIVGGSDDTDSWYGPSITDSAFSVNLGSTSGFSLIGSGGDSVNTVDVIPTDGESGVDLMSDSGDIFSGTSSDSEGSGDDVFGDINFSGFGDYYDDELDFLFFEDLEVVNTRHSAFRSSYDECLGEFLAG